MNSPTVYVLGGFGPGSEWLEGQWVAATDFHALDKPKKATNSAPEMDTRHDASSRGGLDSRHQRFVDRVLTRRKA